MRWSCPVGRHAETDVAEPSRQIVVDRPVEGTELDEDEQPELELVDVGGVQPSSKPPIHISISRKSPIVSAEPDMTLLASSSTCNQHMQATSRARHAR